MNPWILVALAIFFEVAGIFLLKLSDGFEKWHWGMLSIICYFACFWVLAPALKAMPVGVVYAVWAGVGIVTVTLMGIFAFDERLNALQYLCIALVLIGSIGLRLTTTAA